MEVFGRPVVDLEAGAGPDNPPCPACREPLFGWALLRPNETPVRRCERCGMAVAGGPAAPEEAREAIFEAAAAGTPVANRRSVQASIGSSGWALLQRDSRFAFSGESVERLGGIAGRPRFSPMAMWQTLVNSFTFGHNVALGWVGRAVPTQADGPVRRTVDVVISTVTALPLLVVALVLEGLAWAVGRGGTLTVHRGPGAENG